MAKRPRQKKLPTLEDTKIKGIEDAAEDYVEARTHENGSRRQDETLGGDEEGREDQIQAGHIDVRIVVEKEKVLVRAKKPKADLEVGA